MQPPLALRENLNLSSLSGLLSTVIWLSSSSSAQYHPLICVSSHVPTMLVLISPVAGVSSSSEDEQAVTVFLLPYHRKVYNLLVFIIEKCIFATEIFKFQLVMKRKIYKQLLKWKESKDRKPLMLLGARQVGKTWIMQHFGKRNTKRSI